MTIISFLAAVSGIFMGIANFPQAYKIFKRKSAKDISIIAFSVLFVGAVIWILYGIEIEQYPIIIANVFGAISLGLIVLGWFLYGKD